jgi:hypothetical protein
LYKIIASVHTHVANLCKQTLALDNNATSDGKQYRGKDYYKNGIKHFCVGFFDIHDQVLLGCDNANHCPLPDR